MPRLGEPSRAGSSDPIYPAYIVGDADNSSETTRVAVVTGQKSSSNQLEDLLRRAPAPKPEVPAVEGNTELSTCGCELSSADKIGTDVALLPRRTAPMTAAATATATRPTRLDRRGVFLLWKVWSCSDTLSELR